MRLPRFRLQTLFLIVLICACVLMGIDRPARLTDASDGFRTWFAALNSTKPVMGPALDRHELRHKVARELAAKHGFAEELLDCAEQCHGSGNTTTKRDSSSQRKALSINHLSEPMEEKPNPYPAPQLSSGYVAKRP